MAYAHAEFAHSNQSGFMERIQKVRAMLDQRAARRAAYRQTVNELQALTDRDLADLGLHRSDIPRVARQAAATA